MALPITFNNTVYQAGFFGTDDGGVPTNATRSFRIDDVYSFPVTVNGTVTDANSTVTLTYTFPGDSSPTTQTLNATNLDNPNMILFTGRGVPGSQDGTLNRYVFSNVQMYGTTPPAGQVRTTFADDGNNTLGAYAAPVCFAAGTLIRTTRGNVAVERLCVDDMAVTSSGELRPIRWVGSRTIDCRRHPDPASVLPVRIRAGALGEGKPARDLRVSPAHAIAVDVLGEILIPAAALVNGSTIVQEEVDSVTYWHVELDSHDLLVAEGLGAESYLDMGNRSFFAGNGVVELGATPDGDAASRTHADFCRPFHDGGALVDVVRTAARLRAGTLGWTIAEPESWADVHLEVDGRIVHPKTRGLSGCFVLPADAKDVWLVSPTSVPRDISDSSDSRTLGLNLSGLSLDDGLGKTRKVALDDPRLSVGFHKLSPGHRWTAGRAKLPSALLEGLEGDVFLRVELSGPSVFRWVGPDAAAEEATIEAPRLRLIA